MSDYYVNGYTPPRGVDSRDKVRRIQATLGVKQDGVWGPNTQTAWVTQGFGNVWVPQQPSANAAAAKLSTNYVEDGYARPAKSVSGQTTLNSRIDETAKQLQSRLMQMQANPSAEKQALQKSSVNAGKDASASRFLRSNYVPLEEVKPPAESAQVQKSSVTAGNDASTNRFLHSNYVPLEEVKTPAESAQASGRAIIAEPAIWNRAMQQEWDEYQRKEERAQASASASASPAAPIGAEARAAHKLAWAVSKNVQSARLTNYEKEQAVAFVDELSPQRLNLVANWIEEKGPEKFFHGYNIRSTAERLIKETGGASVAEHKISPELAQSSYFRPRIYDFEADSLQANYPQISFSDYYYSEGEYRVKVYNHGDLVGSLSLGKELPNDSVIRISLADIGNVAADQLRLYVAMMASPPMLVDMATTYLWGENLLTSMPVVEDFLQSIDPWDHEAHVSMGDIIVGVEASYDAKAFKADTGYNSIIIKRK